MKKELIKLFRKALYQISSVNLFRRIVVFYGASAGYSGNAMLAYNELKNKAACVFVSDLKKDRARGAIYTYSFKGLLFLLFSSVYVISVRMPGFVSAKSNKVIQLWHGIPVKNIGTHSESYSSDVKQKMCEEFSYYDYIFAAGPRFQDILRSSFCLGCDSSFVECLSPVHYELLKIKGSMKQQQPKRALLYCPTFRDEGSPESWDLLFDRSKALIEYLEAESITLFCKYHPNDVLRRPRLSDNIVLIDANEDVYQYLPKVYGVITDYSSMIFDAALLELDVYLFCPDFVSYKAIRGLSDLELFSDENVSLSQETLVTMIKNRVGSRLSSTLNSEYFGGFPGLNPYELIEELLW